MKRTKRDLLRDIEDRLNQADRNLDELYARALAEARDDALRLGGKREGVRLALSYVQDEIRTEAGA